MNFLNPEQNSGGRSPLYTSERCSSYDHPSHSVIQGPVAAEPQPPTLFEPPVSNQAIFSQQSQPLYVNNFNQNALWLPATESQANIINNGGFQTYAPGEFLAAGPRHAALFEFPPVDNQLIFDQQDHPLYANSFNQDALWLSAAEPQENIINNGGFQNYAPGEFLAAGPQPAPVGNQLIFDQQNHPPYANNFYQHVVRSPVAELQENIINAENLQAEPNGEVEPVDLQPHHHPLPPVVPAIPNDAAHGAGNRPGQELRCGNRCRGVFGGPHKCIRHGRSLKISCRGDDGNCPSEFSKRNDFNRHCGSVHRGDRAEAPVERLIDCPFAGCDRVREKGFKRKDNLTQHRRNVHEERIVKNPIRFGRNNDAA